MRCGELRGVRIGSGRCGTAIAGGAGAGLVISWRRLDVVAPTSELLADTSLAWHHPDDDPNVAYGFCRECGGSLFWKVVEGPAEQMDDIAICAGTLDLPSGLHTERALFVDDAADYHTLDPAVPGWSRE